MTEERKKSHVWPWVVALLVGLLVLYVLSGAPAEFLLIKMGEPQWLVVPAKVLYAPLRWLLNNSPQFVRDWYAAYCDLLIAILGEP